MGQVNRNCEYKAACDWLRWDAWGYASRFPPHTRELSNAARTLVTEIHGLEISVGIDEANETQPWIATIMHGNDIASRPLTEPDQRQEILDAIMDVAIRL